MACSNYIHLNYIIYMPYGDSVEQVARRAFGGGVCNEVSFSSQNFCSWVGLVVSVSQRLLTEPFPIAKYLN